MNKTFKKEDGVLIAEGKSAINYYDFRGCKELKTVVIPESAVIINDPVVKMRKKRHLTEEHKRKISEAHKGRKLTEEHKKHIGDGHRGMKYNKYTLDAIQPIEIVPEKTVEPVATVSIPEMKTRKSMFETVKDFLYSKVLTGFKKLTSFFKIKRKQNEAGSVNDNVETKSDQTVESHVESSRRDDLIPVNIESAEDFRIANDLPKVKMSYIDMKPRAIRSNRRKSNRRNYKRTETNTTVMHNDDSTQAA